MTYQKEMQQPEEGLSAGVCDLIFREGAVTSVRIKQDVIKGGLLSYDDTSIEIGGYGKIGHTGRIPVYQTYGEIAEKSLSDVILGNMEADYVTGDNQVCAILIRPVLKISAFSFWRTTAAISGRKYICSAVWKRRSPAVRRRCLWRRIRWSARQIICRTAWVRR